MSDPQQMKKLKSGHILVPHYYTIRTLNQAATCQACDSVRPQKGITTTATREISYRLQQLETFPLTRSHCNVKLLLVILKTTYAIREELKPPPDSLTLSHKQLLKVRKRFQAVTFGLCVPPKIGTNSTPFPNITYCTYCTRCQRINQSLLSEAPRALINFYILHLVKKEHTLKRV